MSSEQEVNYWIRQEKDPDGNAVFYLFSTPKKISHNIRPELIAVFFKESYALRTAVLLSMK